MAVKIIVEHNKKDDIDIYMVERKTPLSTHEYNIFVDFKDNEIVGDCVRYGGWDDIELDECIEVLEIVRKQGKLRRDYKKIKK